jgi:hypothetical protein
MSLGELKIMSDIKGCTFIFGKGIFHITNKYINGLWFDKNDYYKQSKNNRKGFGILIKLSFGYIVRPIPIFWKKDFWTRKVKIKDIPKKDWNKFFGKKLANKLRILNPHCYKYSVYNPWFAKRLFVLRLPKWIPTFFISIGTPWKNFYIGFKDFEVDVHNLPGNISSGRDISWTSNIDKKRAQKNKPKDIYYALCPSITFRDKR